MMEYRLIKEFAENNKRLCKAREKNLFNLNIEKYGNAEYYSSYEAVDVITSMIESNEPFFIGRLGGTETKIMNCYEGLKFDINEFRVANNQICELSGFFPKHIGKIMKFCKMEKAVLKDIDAFGMFLWENEEYYVAKYMNPKYCFLANVLDPLYFEKPWTSALAGKRVLVVHPFADTISKQYHNNRAYLFPNSDTLPKFELITIKAVQSLGGKCDEYKTWFEALEMMERQIDKVDFDIALLGCGAYGLPLASHIKNMGKQAIYMGGSLQLMFGIIGKRWENQDYVTRYVNEYWVRPSEKEKIEQSIKVEDECYW